MLANKVDLYWDEVGSAADYYFRDSNSPFVQEAEALVKQLGTRGPSLHHLPVAIEAADYHYVSRLGDLSQQSQLNAPAAEASLRCLIETMEELSHG